MQPAALRWEHHLQQDEEVVWPLAGGVRHSKGWIPVELFQRDAGNLSVAIRLKPGAENEGEVAGSNLRVVANQLLEVGNVHGRRHGNSGVFIPRTEGNGVLSP